MVRKDEVEEQNRSLQSLLEQEMETSSMLRADIADLKQSNLHQQEADLAKINKLQRCVGVGVWVFLFIGVCVGVWFVCVCGCGCMCECVGVFIHRCVCVCVVCMCVWVYV